MLERRSMVKDGNKLNPFLIDKRIVRRNIEKKLISENEFKSYLNHLKDESTDCDVIEISQFEEDF